MASIVGLDDLSKALINAGNSLLSPHSSTEELLTLLDETESLLTNMEQDQPLSMQNALIPSRNALVSVGLLTHPDSDVRVSVVSCLTEILRITSPEAPYSDELMKEIFRLTIESFEKLADASSRSYMKAESVLDNVSKIKSCLVMLDLECDDLILQMIQKFLKIIRSDHSRVVFSSMEMIMITIIDESEEVSTDLLNILIDSVKKENQNVSPMSWSLVEKVLSRCARKLKPYIIQALKSTGTSLDMYSPVVPSICHSVFDTTNVHNIVNTKENEEKLDLGHSRKEIHPKRSSRRPVRDGTRRINENDEVRKGNNLSFLNQSPKQVRSENKDAETKLGITGKRGRKPNSLMNPAEGYDISWISGKRDSLKTSSSKKLQKKGSGGESSLEKVSLTGSLKRKRFKMNDSAHDSDSFSSPRLKKLTSCFRDEEPLAEEPNSESFETPEDDRKIGKSSNKTKSQNGKGQRTAKKNPILEAKIVNSSGKRSSNSKKMVSQLSGRPLAEELEETSKSHPTRKRTARKEVESNGFGENLVGKKVNIWWPLDKTFYEGVIDSYSSRKKMHRVIYYDGDSEELNLNKERWELIEDHSCDNEEKEIDLPESIPLTDIMQRQKVMKNKKAGVSVEPTSSSDCGKETRSNGTIVSEGAEKTGEENNIKSLNAESERREEEEEDKEVSGVNESNRREEQEKKEEEEEEEEEEEKVENPNSEEDEPKWRETDDMDDDDDKRRSTGLSEKEDEET